MAAPANGCEPGTGASHRGRQRRCLGGLPPSIEVQRRRAGIQTAFFPAVLPAVHQHVNERMTDLPWRPQRPGMIAIAPEGPAPAERAVHRPCHANRQAADAAGERSAVVGLHDQVEMIVLYAEVENPRGEPPGRHERHESSGWPPTCGASRARGARRRAEVECRAGPPAGAPVRACVRPRRDGHPNYGVLGGRAVASGAPS